MSAGFEFGVEVDLGGEVEVDMGGEVEVEVDMGGEVEVEVDMGGEVEYEVDMGGEVEVEVDMGGQVEYEVDMGGQVEYEVECPEVVYEVEIEAPQVEVVYEVEYAAPEVEIEIDGGYVVLEQPLVEIEVEGGYEVDVQYETQASYSSKNGDCCAWFGAIICTLMAVSSLSSLCWWIYFCFMVDATHQYHGSTTVKYIGASGYVFWLILCVSVLSCTKCCRLCK